MAKLDFQQWVRTARVTDTPIGDLISDLQTDLKIRPEKFPRPKNADELRSWLFGQGACDGALRAAPAVWRRYCRYLAGVQAQTGE
jgi:hypothetical protein